MNSNIPIALKSASRLALAICAVFPLAYGGAAQAQNQYSGATTSTSRFPPINQTVEQGPRIQLAILLDTSSSMDGLIDQTRNQLWTMVDELASAKQNGQQPHLEVAVFEYGNSELAAEQGYIRQVTALTSELDRVSEALFALRTSGGSEHCGQAIAKAVSQLQWSSGANDLRFIFIAGNEPFTQGPINYSEAIQQARGRDIVVSTIYAGNHEEGVASGWQSGAVLAGGNFMSIDHNQAIAHIEAPQDQQIASLNAKLNSTYIPYGEQGAQAAARQTTQDELNNDVSPALLAKRAKAKASAYYKNSSWDLVDALESGEVKLRDIKANQLPAPMAAMDVEEREQFVGEKRSERLHLKEQIQILSRERDSHIATQKRQQAETAPTVNDALVKSIHEQAAKKAYTFE